MAAAESDQAAACPLVARTRRRSHRAKGRRQMTRNATSAVRRHAIAPAIAICAVLVAIHSGSSAAGAGAPIPIRLGTIAPAGTSYERILKEMGEKWRKTSDGQIVLTIFAGGTQGSEPATVKRMASG